MAVRSVSAKGQANCIGCPHIHPDNGNCTAVGGFYTAVPAAHCPLIPELRAENEKLQADVVRFNDMLASYQNVLVPELRAELEQMKRCIEIVEKQRDAAIEELENYMVQDVLDGNEPCGICAKASDTPCECCDPSGVGQRRADMAQLYKMTLYVCDLEENLSLNEIKRLISDDALDGFLVSCIAHFANEKVGPRIEWDDDIDLNYTDSKAEQWERYFEED